MKVVFIGEENAGLIVLLGLLARMDIQIMYTVTHDLLGVIGKTCRIYRIPIREKIEEGYDLLICCHGRKIITDEELKRFAHGGVNLHPFLSKYKGAKPAKRALENKDFDGSVGIHQMTNKIDSGKCYVEYGVYIGNCKTEKEIYNSLYPYYLYCINDFLDKLIAERVESCYNWNDFAEGD